MTYEELEALTAGRTFPIHAENDDGETVIIGRTKPGDNAFFKVTTYQKNGWTRINYIFQDGTCEELFEKEKTE